MLDDVLGRFKERIVALTTEEFPGCRVVFEDEADTFIHFDIRDSDEKSILPGGPAYLAVEIADWPEQKFRYIFCQVCGKYGLP
jgi:hypothetical protein